MNIWLAILFGVIVLGIAWAAISIIISEIRWRLELKQLKIGTQKMKDVMSAVFLPEVSGDV